jgi:hypothetical protein
MWIVLRLLYKCEILANILVNIEIYWISFLSLFYFKILYIKIFNAVFSLLDVLSVYDLIFESITQCVGQLNEYLAVYGNYNNMAARFEHSEESQIYQDFIEHFHVVNKIYLKSEIFLI